MSKQPEPTGTDVAFVIVCLLVVLICFIVMMSDFAAMCLREACARLLFRG